MGRERMGSLNSNQAEANVSSFERDGRRDWIELLPSTNGGLVRMLRLKQLFRERPVRMAELQRDLRQLGLNTDVTVIEVDGLDYTDPVLARIDEPNLWILVACHPGRLKQWSKRLPEQQIFYLQDDQQLKTLRAMAEFYASL